MRGIEVWGLLHRRVEAKTDDNRYDNAEALTMTHRSSDEYKCMRSAMIPEAITEEPTDLRPLQPTEIGFLARHKELHDFSRGDGHEQFLVVRRFSPLAGQRGELLELLRRAVAKIDKEAEHREHIRSFWALEYGPDLNDATIVTVERYDSRAIYEKTAELLEDLM